MTNLSDYVNRLCACGYERFEAGRLCQMILKECGMTAVLRFVQSAERGDNLVD